MSPPSMSTRSQDATLPTVADLEHLQYTAYFDLATYAVLVYDHLLTFERERRLVWPMPYHRPIKILFLLTRYLPYFDMTFCLWHHFTANMTVADCVLAYRGIGWPIMIGFVLAESILCLRTWAVWERSLVVGIGLIVWLISIWVTNFVIIGFFLQTIQFTPLPDNIPGCFVTAGSEIIAIDWVLLMVFEGGVLALMLIKAFKSYRLHGYSHVYRTVYRDGSLFYVYLFALSVVNVVIIVTLPADLATMLSNFEHVIHAVLTERIILTLRGLGYRSLEEDSRMDTRIESIHFAERPKAKATTSGATTGTFSETVGSSSFTSP